MSSRSHPARYGISKSKTRKNRPQVLTPWWHETVRKVVEKEKKGVLQAERDGICYDDVVNEMNRNNKPSKAGRPGSVPEVWLGLLRHDPEIIIAAVEADAGFLLHPMVVDVIREERAKAKNAIGRDEWTASVDFFDRLSECLIGIWERDTPGFPKWFWKCIRLEFEATYKDVDETMREYDQFPEAWKRELSSDTFMRRELKLKHCRLGTRRESTVAIMAERWGVSPGTVKNWLKPAKRPGYVPVEKQRVVVFKIGGKELVYDPKERQPPTQRGRPRKQKDKSTGKN